MLQRQAGKEREKCLLLLGKHRRFIAKRPPSPAAFFIPPDDQIAAITR
jgi:hypothetical protein